MRTDLPFISIYDALPPEQMNAFHELELLAVFQNAKKWLPQEVAMNHIIAAINLNRQPDLWDREIRDFLSFHTRPNSLRDLRILYYRASGCGINKLTRFFQLHQSTIMKILEKNVAEIKPNIPNLFNPEFHNGDIANENLQRLLSIMNVLDGFRILEPKFHPNDPRNPNNSFSNFGRGAEDETKTN